MEREKDQRRIPRAVGASALVLALIGLSACSSTKSDAHERSDAWDARMEQFLTDPDGQGEGSGDVPSAVGDAKPSAAHVTLGSIRLGQYDVLAVCTGTAVVHVVVTADGTIGGRETLATSDVPCGATVRLALTFPSGSADIAVSRKTLSDGDSADEAEGGQWYASIVSRGWDPGVVGYG